MSLIGWIIISAIAGSLLAITEMMYKRKRQKTREKTLRDINKSIETNVNQIIEKLK